MPKNDRIGERYFNCERCGFQHAESDLAVEQQTGRRVCTKLARCFDLPGKDSEGLFSGPSLLFHRHEDDR